MFLSGLRDYHLEANNRWKKLGYLNKICSTFENIVSNQNLKFKGGNTEKEAIEVALKDLDEAIKGSDKEAIEAKTEALGKASQKLGEKVMAAEQAKAGAAAGAAPGGAAPGQAPDADVVDADFKEVDDKK